jgi:hypothetical protein
MNYQKWLKFCLVLTAFSLSACGMPMRYGRNITVYEPMKEVSVIKDLELAVPKGSAKKAESTFMVAFVQPTYEITPETYTANPYAGASVPYKKSDIAKQKYQDAIRDSLKTDLDYILLQKGIRVLGSFRSRDEMTFDQKKRAVYAFQPTIKIFIDEQKTEQTGRGYTENGLFTIRGYINLLLAESITGEKIWLKRIEAQPINRPYEFAAKFKEPSRVVTEVDYLFASGVEEKDNSDKALAEALAEFYASLGKKLSDHIDTEEWERYLKQVADLRDVKRY